MRLELRLQKPNSLSAVAHPQVSKKERAKKRVRSEVNPETSLVLTSLEERVTGSPDQLHQVSQKCERERR